MDGIDIIALGHLQARGRESWARLGEILGMTGPAAAERVRRLEEQGVIRSFAAIVDPQAVGMGVTAFISVVLERPKHRAPFLSRVAALDEVQECHHMAGEDDYLLKVRCRSILDLDRLITEEIKSISGVARTRTTIALRTAKETWALPLGTSAAAGSGRRSSGREGPRTEIDES